MNHLILFAHPNPNSFCKAIVNNIESTAKEHGVETKVRDLYSLNFQPQLSSSDFETLQKGETPKDIQEEQKHITWADIITVVYPIWWANTPAILKGYIDRVFANGFAYKYTETGPVGLLKGKKVMLFSTMGSPVELYDKNGLHKAVAQVMETGVFNFVGIEVLSHTFYGAVPFVDDDTRKGYLEDAKQIAKKVFSK